MLWPAAATAWWGQKELEETVCRNIRELDSWRHHRDTLDGNLRLYELFRLGHWNFLHILINFKKWAKIRNTILRKYSKYKVVNGKKSIGQFYEHFLKFDWCFRRGVSRQCVTVPVFSSHSSLYFDWKAQSDPSPSLWLRPPVSPSHWYMRPLRASDWLLRPVLSHLECLDWSSGPHTSQGQNHQNGITIKKDKWWEESYVNLQNMWNKQTYYYKRFWIINNTFVAFINCS